MRKNKNQDDELNLTIIFSFIIVLPFILWKVEMVLPYPEVIEELVKLAIVMMILRKVGNGGWYWVLAAGALLGLSESFLYLINVNFYGNIQVLWARLFLTVPMHILTISVIYRLGKYGRFGLIVGFILAIFIHYGFNVIVG